MYLGRKLSDASVDRNQVCLERLQLPARLQTETLLFTTYCSEST